MSGKTRRLENRLGSRDITTRETRDSLQFGNSRLTLTFSKKTGSWIGLRDRHRSHTWSEPASDETSLTFRVSGESVTRPGILRNSRLPSIGNARTIGLNRKFSGFTCVRTDASATLRISSTEDEWAITELFTLEVASGKFHRRAEIEYRGEQTLPLRDVTFVTPELIAEPARNWTIEAPGYPVRPGFPISEMQPGEWGGTAPSLNPDIGTAQQDADATAAKPGIIGLHNGKQQHTLLCRAFSEEIPSILAVERTKHGVRFRQHILAAQWVYPGSRIHAGTQILSLPDGPWLETLTTLGRRWEKYGVSIPGDRPPWSRNAAIYEVHIGKALFPGADDDEAPPSPGLPHKGGRSPSGQVTPSRNSPDSGTRKERSYEPYPTLEHLIRDLARIRDLGFDTLLLMPQQPFPSYTVHDFLDAETTYGGDDALKQMVHRAHELDLRVLLDFVMHGCIDKPIVRGMRDLLGDSFSDVLDVWEQKAFHRSPYLEQHPGWFMRDENGEITGIYTAAFDHNNDEWQEFIIDVLCHYVREYDVDGFRIDAPTWNFMPNWDRSIEYPAYASYYGAARLFAKARPILRKLKPELVLYTEPGGPLFRRDFDLNYNYDEQWVFPALVSVPPDRPFACERTFEEHRLAAGELTAWLEARRLVLPPGSITVHHLDSHDTFWWGRLAQFRSEVFGRDAASALFAFCAFLNGAIMNYVGGEKGAEDFYRRILHLRREIPQIRDGECQYLRSASDRDDVFTVFWQDNTSAAVPVINLGDSPISCTVQTRLPAEAPLWEVRDAMTGRALVDAAASDHGILSVTTDLDAYGVRLLLVRPAGRSE